VITDATGNFSFPELPAAGVYTVRAAKDGFSFAPAVAEFNGLASPGSVTFIATATPRIRIFVRSLIIKGTPWMALWSP
jgi:hypothetical protein